MKIIIPMTGYGSRFVAAGFKDLKPFIPVQGIPIIEWIIKGMYPGETDFLFVCRKEHLEKISGMRDRLMRLAPRAQIAAIDNWVKKGPVFDVLQASELINDGEQCIINYCDFFQQWDYDKFSHDVTARNCDGCIPCYSGFHPHLLIDKNVYASCQTDDDDNLIEIREKYSFSKDKFLARHSPGIYWFKTGALLKKYCQRLVDENTNLNGEFYASLPYNNMVKDKLTVWVPVLDGAFCQWGTPEDLSDYLFWTNSIWRREL